MANTTVSESEAVELHPEPELNLLLEWPQDHTPGEWLVIVAITAAIHILLFVSAIRIGNFVSPAQPERNVIVKRIPLYLPQDLLTQRAPNKAKITKHIDLNSLLALQQSQPSRSAPRVAHTRTPAPKRLDEPLKLTPVQARPAPTRILPEAPTLALNQPGIALPAGTGNGIIAPAPPPPVATENPFQNIGADNPLSSAKPAILPPKGSVKDVVQGLSQNPNGSRVVITDDSQSSPRPGLSGSTGRPSNQHSGVELMSDPQGADLRPYLAQILSIVRANWRHVIPESASVGKLRGRTVVEFALDRNGRILKLVIGDYSGSQALDSASVAGLSMSNPLPPVPADYKGLQLRLAFTFAYNMPAQ